MEPPPRPRASASPPQAQPQSPPQPPPAPSRSPLLAVASQLLRSVAAGVKRQSPYVDPPMRRRPSRDVLASPPQPASLLASRGAGGAPQSSPSASPASVASSLTSAAFPPAALPPAALPPAALPPAALPSTTTTSITPSPPSDVLPSPLSLDGRCAGVETPYQTHWLLELPRHVLVHRILLPHLTGADVRALCSASRGFWYELEDDDALWKGLFDARGPGIARPVPRFPTCGTWRDVYLRAIQFKTLVLVRTLTKPDMLMRLTVSRSMSLFALKREVRRAQCEADGVALEDFELVDADSSLRLGVAGNDSLPPYDLGRLFWLDAGDPGLRFGRVPGGVGAGLGGLRAHGGGIGGGGNEGHFAVLDLGGRPSSRDAWRRTVSGLPDGTVLVQTFAGDNAVSPADRAAIQGLVVDELESIDRAIASTTGASSAAGGGGGGEDQSQVPRLLERLTLALEEAHVALGPNGFKAFWRKHSVHPLLRVVVAPRSRMSHRFRALMLFLRAYARLVFRTRFALDVVVRALLTSGFPLSFYRLSVALFPMIYRTQIQNMLDADVDLIFALRLLRDVVLVTKRAFAPVMRQALLLELLSTAAKLGITWESRAEQALLISGVALVQMLRGRRRQGAEGAPLGAWGASQTSLQFLVSAGLWAWFEEHSDPALSVSLPVYLFAIPVISCAIVVRIRMFLAQSYISLLLL